MQYSNTITDKTDDVYNENMMNACNLVTIESKCFGMRWTLCSSLGLERFEYEFYEKVGH